MWVCVTGSCSHIQGNESSGLIHATNFLNSPETNMSPRKNLFFELSWCYDLRSGDLFVFVLGNPFGSHDQIFLFPLFRQKIALLFVLGRPLWREDRSAMCSAIHQWSESWRTHNRTLLFHLRLLSSLFVASYDSQGLRWKYSNPPANGACSL
jgi:hypothetical protein